jgi:hypothetical protein
VTEPKRRRDLLPPLPPKSPDELAAELEGYVPSPWHEWLERQRRKPTGSDGLVDHGDGGAGTWEQDHPPHGVDPPPKPRKPLPPAA